MIIIKDTNTNNVTTNSKLDSMLTTVDNPFSPFNQYEQWFAFDVAHGYNTSAYLARIAKLPDDLSDYDESLALEQAIDDIVRLNILGIYIKVSPLDFRPPPRINSIDLDTSVSD